MHRSALSTFALAGLTLAALSLAPALASAEEPPMCAEGMVPMSLPAWLVPAHDPAELVAPAPTAPASHEVLWCHSGFDTRCSPRPSPADTMFSSLLHTLLAPTLLARTSVPAPPVANAAFVETRLSPRDGVRTPLERPPR